MTVPADNVVSIDASAALHQAKKDRILQGIREAIQKNIWDAEAQFGVVITVRQEPLQPLAMGNYMSVVEVRQSRTR